MAKNLNAVLCYFIPFFATTLLQFQSTLGCAVENNNSSLTPPFTPMPTPADTRLNQLASYIAGLFEGDGHIWIPSTPFAPSGIRYKPRFHITFTLKDLPLAQLLSNLLGGVQIRIKEPENACVLTVNSIDKIIILVNLCNGLLRTPKIEQFDSLIKWLNSNGYGPFTLLPIDSSSLLSNSWLAGFIDADGGFKIRHTQEIRDESGKLTRKGRIACSLVLEQRMETKSGLSYLKILTTMCNTFNCNLTTSTHSERTYFVFAISSMVQLSLLVSYLDQHPLMGSKYLDYIAWRSVYFLIRDRAHLTPEGSTLIAKYKSEINNSRTVYTWDHLITNYT